MKNNHQVTAIREQNSRKKIIYIDGDLAFALYNGEVCKYGLKEGKEVSDQQIEFLKESVLWPRAKERALNLMTASWKTSGEVFRKLRAGYYPVDICNRVISFLEEYGYLNDYEYARTYVQEKISGKSIRMIQAELKKKGIQENVIRDVIQEIEPSEQKAICRYIRKRVPDISKLDYTERAKIYTSLLRKGYSNETICKIINNINLYD